MSREAAIFAMISDKDQTIKKLIVKDQERIMTAINFRRQVQELEIEIGAREYFERIFLNYDPYYVRYEKDSYESHKIFQVKRGQVIIAIFSVNSAGCWEGLQILPTKFGSSNIIYYTEKEEISMPS
jgi:hypothetical protein